MIFSQPLSRVANRVSQHDFALDALASEPSSGLPLGDGDLSASLYGGPGRLALGVRKGNVPAGEIVLHFSSHESQPSPRAVSVGEGLTRPPVLLRLYDATARIALPDAIEIEAFVAATRNLIVLRIRSQSPLSLPAMLELCHESSIPRYAPAELLGIDGLPYPRVATESRVSRGGATPHAWHDGPFRYLQQNLSASLSAVLCGFVYGARSHSVVRENAVLVTFDVPPSGECLILVGVATAQDGPDPALRARAEVERALPHGYLLLQREHAVWWERFWETAESASAAGDVDYRNLYLSRATPHGV